MFLRYSMLLAALLAATLALAARNEQGVSDREIRIGGSTALSGPLGPTAKLLYSGARLYFDKINAAGGVHGRKIQFELLDDGFEPSRAVENTRQLIHERKVFTLFGNAGSAQIAAILPLVAETQTVLFGPITGAPGFRKQHLPTVFHVRASYTNEIERIVEHAKTVGIRRIALFHTDDALGKLVLNELTEALKKHDLPVTAVASAALKDGDLDGAAKSLASQQPQAIMMGTVGLNFTKFIASYRKHSSGIPQFYGLSLVDPGLIASELGDAGRGIVLTQIMPSVRHMTMPIVREYRDALAKARPGAEPTILELDAFVNAKIFVEALRRAGKNPTRSGLITALEGMGRFDLGGLAVTYTPQNHNGSNFVDLAIVGARGKLTY